MRILYAHQEAHMKRSANLSIDEELLSEAKAAGINLSETFETALRRRLKEERAQAWLRENAGSIRAFNESVAKTGTFAEQFLDE
jgi:antitoxin CcdA